MSLAQLFPEGVGLLIMGYIPQYERDQVFIHELVAGNLFFGCSNTRDYCLKKLLPRLEAQNPEDYFSKINLGERKYQIRRYLMEFTSVEQYALFEYCLPELSAVFKFGRRIQSRLSFEQYDFNWFRNACAKETMNESWDKFAMRIKDKSEPERKVKIEVVLSCKEFKYSPPSYVDERTDEQKAKDRAEAEARSDALIKAKEEADARVEAKRREKIREARKKEKEAAKKAKITAEALKTIRKKKK